MTQFEFPAPSGIISASETTYDPTTGLPTSFTASDGGVISMTWDQAKLTQAQDALDNFITYTFDGNRRVSTITYPDGGVVSVGYDSAGRPSVIEDPIGGYITYTYDGVGRVETYSGPEGVASWTYDDAGRITAMQYLNNLLTLLSFDPATGQLVQTQRPAGSSSPSLVTTMQFDTSGHITGYTAPGDRTTNWQYDDRGNPIVITDPGGNSVTYGYDTSGDLTDIEDPLGREWALKSPQPSADY